MIKIKMQPFEVEFEDEEDALGFIEELEGMITKYSVIPHGDNLDYDFVEDENAI